MIHVVEVISEVQIDNRGRISIYVLVLHGQPIFSPIPPLIDASSLVGFQIVCNIDRPERNQSGRVVCAVYLQD